MSELNLAAPTGLEDDILPPPPSSEDGSFSLARAAAGLALAALMAGGLAAIPESAAASTSADNCNTEVLAPGGYGQPVDPINRGDVFLVAHGGSRGPMIYNGHKTFADFNTVRSQVRAAKHGADGSENDFTGTNTYGESVQQHNPKLQMVIFGTGTNGEGVIRDMSVRKIQDFYVTPNKEPIDTETQSFKKMADYQCQSLVLEQKAKPSKAIINKQVEAIRSHNNGRGSMLSSSLMAILRLDKKRDAGIARMYIQRGLGLPRRSFIKDHANLITAVGVYFKKITPSFVIDMHKMGVRVNARGMITAADYREVQNKDRVDMEMDDNMDKAVEIRQEYISKH